MKIKKNVHINEEIREIEAFYGWNTSISMSCNERYSVVLHPTLNFSFICLVTGWNILAFALLLCLWARQGLHCATYAVTRGPWFLQSLPKDSPILSPGNMYGKLVVFSAQTEYPSFNFKRSCCSTMIYM